MLRRTRLRHPGRCSSHRYSPDRVRRPSRMRRSARCRWRPRGKRSYPPCEARNPRSPFRGHTQCGWSPVRRRRILHRSGRCTCSSSVFRQRRKAVPPGIDSFWTRNSALSGKTSRTPRSCSDPRSDPGMFPRTSRSLRGRRTPRSRRARHPDKRHGILHSCLGPQWCRGTHRHRIVDQAHRLLPRPIAHGSRPT